MLERISPKNTAVLVMDIQNDFCDSRGVLSKQLGLDMSLVREMVPRLIGFVDKVRDVGFSIVFTQQHEVLDGAPKTIKALFNRNKLIPSCGLGSWGAGFYKIKPKSSDLVLEKRTWDAFTNSKLGEFLKANKIEFLIVTGVFTTMCVESTIRRAFSEGYEVIVPEDLVADCGERLEHHKLSLKFFDTFLGVITTSGEINKLFK